MHLFRSVGVALLCGIGLPAAAWASGEAATRPAPQILEVDRIWDQAPHSAFTDLIRYRGHWFCTFREGRGHEGGNGRIRLLHSSDGRSWSSAALLEPDGYDLRDPKLSITPDDRLMLLLGGSVYVDGKNVARQSHVSFSTDGRSWSTPQPVDVQGGWLWRVTWHEGMGYGVTYDLLVPEGREWTVKLWSTRDGIAYEQLTTWDISGQPNETTLRFLDDGTMVALVRREAGDRKAWIGTSRAPYTDWAWKPAAHQIGGPNFIVLPDGSMWAAGRDYRKAATTMLARMRRDGYEPVLTLPSGGDCSYPGLYWHEGVLWVSYYASHEGKSSIYLARIKPQ